MRKVIFAFILTTILSQPSDAFSEEKHPAVPGEFILRPKVAVSFEQRLLGQGLEIKKVFRSGAILVKIKPEYLSSERQILNALENDTNIAYIEPNYYYYLQAKTPNDPSFDKLFGLHNEGQDGGLADADIDAPEAWEVSTGSRQVRVGVIDSGIDYNHPDLKDNVWHNPGETGKDAEGKDKAANGVDDDMNGYVDDFRGWDFSAKTNDPLDENSHGTHCSGTIGAAGDNGAGVVGVNWQVSIVPIKVFDSSGTTTSDVLVEAIEYATSLGVDITSNSWGGGAFSQAMYDAIKEAEAKGILFVAAAGNSAADNDDSDHYPSNYRVGNVLAVAATDRQDKLASFSSYGRRMVPVAAPGKDIFSTIPDGEYGRMSGTSMATPHVSGLAALIKSVYPDATYKDLKHRIVYGADSVTSLQGKVGFGRINAFSSLENDQTPPGVVQDLAAVPHDMDAFQVSFNFAGDDGDEGKAVHYVARISDAPVEDEDQWQAARKAALVIVDEVNGRITARIGGLQLNSKGFVTLRAVDNVGHWGPLSQSAAFEVGQVEELYANDATSMDGIAAEAPWGLENGSGGSYFSDSPRLPYKESTNASLMLPPYAVQDEEIYLNFSTQFKMEKRADFGFVEISVDEKKTWKEVAKVTGQENLHPMTIDLSPAVKPGDKLYIRFRFQSDFSVNMDGWLVNNIFLFKRK